MIAGLTYYQIFQYFLIYSFLGWCTEVVYQAVSKGRIVNRGFLNGPVCPIYGFGVLAVFATINTVTRYFQLQNGKTNLLVIFLCGIALTTSIELIGGWALDKIFHARWWDYSGKPFNFHGYICLEFSLIWGMGIVLIVEVVHPLIKALADKSVPESIGWPVMGVLYAFYAADFIVSVMVMAGLNKRMAELDEMREKMRVVSNKLSSELGKGALETAQHMGEVKVQAALAKAEVADGLSTVKAEAVDSLSAAKAEAAEGLSAVKSEIKESMESAQNARSGQLEKLKALHGRKSKELSQMVQNSRYFGAGRLLRAFPDMKHREYGELLEELKKEVEEEEGV